MRESWEICFQDVLLIRSCLSREREQIFIIEDPLNYLPAFGLRVFHSRSEILQSFSDTSSWRWTALRSLVPTKSQAHFTVSSSLLSMKIPRDCFSSSRDCIVRAVYYIQYSKAHLKVQFWSFFPPFTINQNFLSFRNSYVETYPSMWWY